MKRLPNILARSSLLVLLSGELLMAQGVADPLRIQGMDRFTIPSARARGMGWSATAVANDASALFTNPAALTRVEGIEFRVGGSSRGYSYTQTQEWTPDRLYATLSLLFEDRLSGIVDTAAVKLERGYDNLGPNWDRTRGTYGPTSLAAAMTLNIGDITIVPALGFHQVIQLDHYYQNNNALNPYIGSNIPEPIFRPAIGETVKVQWYQFTRKRKGSVYGITPGIGVVLSERISLGISVSVLTGTSDDFQTRRERGFLRLTTNTSGAWNVYYVDSVKNNVTRTGESDYSGTMVTLGALYTSESFAAGLSLRQGPTLTRAWSSSGTQDTSGGIRTTEENGSEELSLPACYALGVAFFPNERLTVGVDYILNRYSEAEYRPSPDSLVRPWFSSQMFRLGVEYRPAEMLALRAGYREDTQVFVPVGSGLLTEPAGGSVYSVGAGLRLGIVQVDAAYEYGRLKYRDTWGSNVNYNSLTTHQATVDIAVHF